MMKSSLLLRCCMMAILFTCARHGVADSLAVKQSAQGISYVTGGISQDEVDALSAYKAQFNLYLLFSEGSSGRAATPVNVDIYDASNQHVFRIKGASPRLLVNLPAGTFTVLATYNGDRQRYKFKLKNHEHRRVILNWKNVTDEDTAAEGEDSESDE